MERKKAIVHIRGMQFTASAGREEESGAIETVTTGYLQKIGESWFLKYEEIQEDFDLTSDVLIKAAPGRLELVKKGLLNVSMEFADGEFTQSDYHTPYGNILFGFHTGRVTVLEKENSVEMRAAYLLEANGEYLADSNIEILAEYI
ncbi:MAG: DUF1934 domain-containing protein [Lachnospiraceae bacterium]|nr:DUF1934 domain-containing protein [Lachnospiraceae bacterium]